MAKKKNDTHDIEARIRTAYDSMSAGQQKVAEFVLTRGVEAVYLPAARIAELAGVSHSTVVRTAQVLGFDGFPELQTALQERFRGRMSAVDRFQFGSEKMADRPADLKDGEGSSVLHRVMLADAAHIENTVQQIPVADFERAVEMLDGARRVYVVGLRASAALALNFGLALRHIRPGCFILQPGFGDLPDKLAEIAEGDLLVTMSYGRYARDTLRCMDYARKAGAQILTVTDSTLSPAAKRADVALVAPIHLWFYVMSAAPLSLVSALVVAVALRHKDDAGARLEHLDEMYQQFQIFENQTDLDILNRIEPRG